LIAIAIQAVMQNNLFFNLLETDFVLAVRKADHDIHKKYEDEYQKVIGKIERKQQLVDYDRSIISINGYLSSIDLDLLKDFQHNLKEEPLIEKFEERKFLQAYTKSLRTLVFGEATTDMIAPVETSAIVNNKDRILLQIYQSFYQSILEAREKIFLYRFWVGALIVLFILKDAFYFYFILPLTNIVSSDNNNLGSKKIICLKICRGLFISSIIILPIVQAWLCINEKGLPLVMFVLFLVYMAIDMADYIAIWVNKTFREAFTKYAHWISLDIAGLTYFLYTKNKISMPDWHDDLWTLPYQEISRNVEAAIWGLSVLLVVFVLMLFFNKKLFDVNMRVIDFLERKVKQTFQGLHELKN